MEKSRGCVQPRLFLWEKAGIHDLTYLDWLERLKSAKKTIDSVVTTGFMVKKD